MSLFLRILKRATRRKGENIQNGVGSACSLQLGRVRAVRACIVEIYTRRKSIHFCQNHPQAKNYLPLHIATKYLSVYSPVEWEGIMIAINPLPVDVPER